MGFIAAVVIALVTFGGPVATAGWWFFGRPWKVRVQILALVFSAAVLWIPAGLVGALLSEILPLDWGHAGAAYVGGYVLGSALVAVGVIVWIVRRPPVERQR